MYFPVSGVDVFPLIPPLIAFLISALTSPAGVSGAFLLLPFQVSVLNYTSPSVSPTNLIYNIIATPGGIYRYIKEKRMTWVLTWIVSAGTIPGAFLGAWIRIYYLPDPKNFKVFVSAVLLYLGYRLLSDILGWNKKSKAQNKILAKKFSEHAQKMKESNSQRISSGLPPEAVVKAKTFSLHKSEFEFWGDTYSVKTIPVFLLSLAVGLVGGIYGIGGGAIIAPFLVSVFALPIYTIAGSALASTFITSVAGIIYYQILAFTAVTTNVSIAPDWTLGILFGVGGLFGTYFGAYLQKFLPEKIVKTILTLLIVILSITYIVQYFS
jgi:uncharacterized membrane protein YfcA